MLMVLFHQCIAQIAHTSPPIPNVAPSYGVPNDVFTDLHCIQNPSQPPVNNIT
jgi:hypothetical protein